MRSCLLGLIAISPLFIVGTHASPYADAVVRYEPGVLPNNLKSFTHSAAVTGEPSRETPGPYGGPVDPFSPPYLNTQVLSVGAGGMLTVRFDTPIENHPAHPYGLDLIIHGNAGFVITNNDFAGGGITDGSLFGNAPAGTVKISVSADNVTFYPLDSTFMPGVDGLFPTDGAGRFGVPVNPALTGSDFSGKDLRGIRSLYGGSAGGAGIDLAWAVTEQGTPAGVDAIRYVRLEVLSGHVDIDGFAAVEAAREPESMLIGNDFATDPGPGVWHRHGDASLFRWNDQDKRLEVTWDSSRPNSFFYTALPSGLGKNDDFQMAFDLELTEIQGGVNPANPFAFELAIGFFNMAQATNPGFSRGTGKNSPNLVEFDYFPDTGYGATLWPTVIATNGVLNYNDGNDYTLIELASGKRYHVVMAYTATEQMLKVSMTQDGSAFGPINSVRLRSDFPDFCVDAFGIASYSDQGSGGSILAKGWLDNLEIRVPAPPVRELKMVSQGRLYGVQFQSLSRWHYQVERSTNLMDWTAISPVWEGNGQALDVSDSAPPIGAAFYRVKAERN
jgi:hypothetical protein